MVSTGGSHKGQEPVFRSEIKVQDFGFQRPRALAKEQGSFNERFTLSKGREQQEHKFSAAYLPLKRLRLAVAMEDHDFAKLRHVLPQAHLKLADLEGPSVAGRSRSSSASRGSAGLRDQR